MRLAAMNPALLQVLRLQAGGKLRRLRRGFSSRRRMILSSLAIVLAVIWLGNAVATVLLRDSFDPERLRRNASLMLLLYFVWHVVRVAWKRPEEAIEWMPAEREFLCGGPFTRRELLMYRLAQVLTATVPKALFVAMLLAPDLPMWWTGLLGLLLGLVLLEYVRVALEIWACGVTGRVYLAWRGLILSGLALLCGIGFWRAIEAFNASRVPGRTVWLDLFAWWGAALDSFRETWMGRVLEFPFATMVEVMTARELNAIFAGHLAVAIALVGLAAYVAIRLDGWFYSRNVALERAHYGSRRRDGSTATVPACKMARLPRVPRMWGAGPLCWRQFKGVRQHAGSVAIALLIPGLMSCLPLTVPGDPATTFLSVAGSALFYSFLLLPAALKFDFRRDFERLPNLKMHPAPVPALVLGQIAVPVLLMTGFQATVMLTAAVIRPVPLGFVGTAVVLLLPVNLLFVALDNLIFLLYPHRQTQEGLEVFLRSTLTFTGKTLIFSLGFMVVTAWFRSAHWLAGAIGAPDQSRWLFIPGTLCLAVAAAALVVMLLVRAFERYDPSADGAA